MSKPQNDKPNSRRRFLLAAAAAGTTVNVSAGTQSVEVRQDPLNAEQRKLVSVIKRHGCELGSNAGLPSRSAPRRW